MNEGLAALMGLGAFGFIIILAILVVTIVAGWKVFAKAGQPGWAILIPIYNLYVLLQIVGRPGWWVILYLIPLVNIVIAIIIAIDMAKSFGQGTGFAVGLIFLAPIFYMILAFGSAEYVGPAATSEA
jgi:hypothetical protein